MSPRANAIIKCRKRVITFAGESARTLSADKKPKYPPRKRKPLPVGSDLFDSCQAATYLNVSPQHLDKMRRTGKPAGPAYVVIGNGLIRYQRAELDRYVASRVFLNTAAAQKTAAE